MEEVINRKRNRLSVIIPWFLFILSTCFIGYLLVQITSLRQSIQNTNQNQVTEIVNAVGKLVVLPQDETPTIATITDLSKLQGQPFFADAAVGDKVLIYTKAQKAILYDPTLNKIIEIAPLNTTSDQITATSTK